MSTDPQTIRLAVETLNGLSNSIDLEVPPADFPTWMTALGFDRAHACLIEELTGIHVWANRQIGDRWWSIDCKLDELLDETGRPIDVPTGGASALHLTRAQLDYLTEEA